jgi:hypothetical protein
LVVKVQILAVILFSNHVTGKTLIAFTLKTEESVGRQYTHDYTTLEFHIQFHKNWSHILEFRDAINIHRTGIVVVVFGDGGTNAVFFINVTIFDDTI